MVVIGIDPGVEKTGVGIVKNEGKEITLLYHTLIKTSNKLSQDLRLKEIYESLSKILDKFNVDCAVIEKIFFAKNVKTAISVSEVRGVLLLLCALKKIPIYEYTPLQVKQALSGYGRAKKDQIKKLLSILLSTNEKFESDDVTDGIALAITHINSRKLFDKIKG